jgi:DnaJ homolog subfamily C member 28
LYFHHHSIQLTVFTELASAVSSFREVLRQSWIRRAIRTLTFSQPAAFLPQLTLKDATSLRDAKWENREKSYHDTAIDELNSLVRKHNGLAPYSVRRPYYIRSVELQKVYDESGEDILRGIKERMKEQTRLPVGIKSPPRTASSDDNEVDYGPRLQILHAIRRWFAKVTGW